MRAKFVYENLNFEKGKDPIEVLELGPRGIILNTLRNSRGSLFMGDKSLWKPIFKYIINPFKRAHREEKYGFRDGHTFYINNFQTLNHTCFLKKEEGDRNIDFVYPLDFYNEKMERALHMSKLNNFSEFLPEVKLGEVNNIEEFKPQLDGIGRFKIIKTLLFKDAPKRNVYVHGSHQYGKPFPESYEKDEGFFLLKPDAEIVKIKVIGGVFNNKIEYFPFWVFKEAYREFGV